MTAPVLVPPMKSNHSASLSAPLPVLARSSTLNPRQNLQADHAANPAPVQRQDPFRTGRGDALLPGSFRHPLLPVLRTTFARCAGAMLVTPGKQAANFAVCIVNAACRPCGIGATRDEEADPRLLLSPQG